LRIIRRSKVGATLILALTAVACEQPKAAPPLQTERPCIADSNSVGFDIALLSETKDSQQWLASYTWQGKRAKFRIQLNNPEELPDEDSKRFGIKSGKGRLIAEPGSDASVLLNDLEIALEAKAAPKRVRRVDALPFTYVRLGDHQSQAPNGGFNAQPPGNWTPIKVFIGEGEQEGEVFMKMNPILKKGQFSIKDEEYGDAALARLAEVL